MDNLKKYLQQHLDELDGDTPDDAVWQKIQQNTAPVLPKRIGMKKWWYYAAAACVLAALLTTFFLVNKQQAGPDVADQPVKDSSKNQEIIVNNIPPQSDTSRQIISPEIIPTAAPKKIAPANAYVKNNRPKKQLPEANNMPSPKRKQLPVNPSQAIVNEVEQNYALLVNRQLDRLRVMPVYAESPDYFSIFKQQFKQIEADEAAIKKDIRQHGLNDELLQQLINISQQKLNVLKALQAEISKLNRKVKQPENRQDSSRSYYLTM